MSALVSGSSPSNRPDSSVAKNHSDLGDPIVTGPQVAAEPCTANSLQLFGTTNHPIKDIVIGMNFRFGPATLFKLESGYAIEIETLKERLTFGNHNITHVKQRIARRAKISADALPIVALPSGDELSVAIILAVPLNMETLKERIQDIIDGTLHAWKKGAAAAILALDDAPAASTRASQTVEGTRTDEAGTTIESDTSGPLKADAMALEHTAECMRRTLTNRHGRGEITIDFAAGGQALPAEPITVKALMEPARKQEPTRGKPCEIVASIRCVLPRGRCEIRQLGASRNEIAEFSTTSQLGLKLKVLSEHDEIRLLVREYIYESSRTSRRTKFYIEDIAGLGESWSATFNILDYYISAIEELKSLPIHNGR